MWQKIITNGLKKLNCGRFLKKSKCHDYSSIIVLVIDLRISVFCILLINYPRYSNQTAHTSVHMKWSWLVKKGTIKLWSHVLSSQSCIRFYRTDLVKTWHRQDIRHQTYSYMGTCTCTTCICMCSAFIGWEIMKCTKIKLTISHCAFSFVLCYKDPHLNLNLGK